MTKEQIEKAIKSLVDAQIKVDVAEANLQELADKIESRRTGATVYNAEPWRVRISLLEMLAEKL